MKITNLLLNELPLLSIVLFFTFYSIAAFAQIHNQLGLPEGAKARLGKGGIKHIKYSPDGKYFAVATSIGIWLYDVNTLQAVDLLTGHDAPVTSIAFSIDGQTLASSCADNIIIIWNTETRKIKAKNVEFDKGKKDINLLTFCPSGDIVACISRSWFIELLNAHTGKLIKTIKDSRNTDINAMAFSTEDNMLITVGFCERNTSCIEYWDTGAGELIRDILIETNITDAAFSPDNKILAVTGNNSHPLQFWDVKTGKHLKNAEKSDVDYEYIAFSHDGSRLVTGGSWEYVSLWDVDTVEELYNVAHGEPINSVAYSPDGGTIACGIDDGTIQIWDTSTGKLQNTIKGHLDLSIFSMAFSPDGNKLACGADSKVLFWNPHTYEHLKTTKEPRCKVVDIEYSPDGNIFATVGTSMKARLWDRQTGRFLGSFIGNHEKYFYSAYRDKEKFTSVSFSPDGNTLATGDTDNEVCLWAIRTGEQYLIGEQLATFTEHTETVTSVAFSPDRKTLASGSLDKTIRLWDVKARKHLKAISGHEKGVNVLAFSPDGKILASGSEDGTIRLLKIDDYEILYAPIENVGNVNAIAFSSDGKILTSINSDSKYINFWNVQTGKLMHTFSGHTKIINAIVYSPDGETLASVSSDGTVLLWDLRKLISDNR